MAVSQHDLVMIAAHVMVAADEINRDIKMSQQVAALADMVRKAKAAIATAMDASSRLEGTAGRVVLRVAEVEALTAALEDAEVQLADALGSSSNGGPPLSNTPAISPEAGIDASIIKVQNANVNI